MDPILRWKARTLRERLPASLADAYQLVRKLTRLADEFVNFSLFTCRSHPH